MPSGRPPVDGEGERREDGGDRGAAGRARGAPSTRSRHEQPILSPSHRKVLLPQRWRARFDTQIMKLVLLAAVATLAVACGATGIGSGSNPTPTPGGLFVFDVTATENDHTA